MSTTLVIPLKLGCHFTVLSFEVWGYMLSYLVTDLSSDRLPQAVNWRHLLL